jgi:hypothetical protein
MRDAFFCNAKQAVVGPRSGDGRFRPMLGVASFSNARGNSLTSSGGGLRLRRCRTLRRSPRVKIVRCASCATSHPQPVVKLGALQRVSSLLCWGAVEMIRENIQKTERGDSSMSYLRSADVLKPEHVKMACEAKRYRYPCAVQQPAVWGREQPGLDTKSLFCTRLGYWPLIRGNASFRP